MLPIDEIQLGIVGPMHPRRGSAGFPGIAAPGVVTGFARARDGVKAPQPFAGLGVIGIDEPAAGSIPAGDPNEQPVADHEGRLLRIEIVGSFAEFDVPLDAPCLRIERNEVRVEGGHIEQTFADRDAAVARTTAVAHLFGRRQTPLVMPEFSSRGCVNGENVIPRRGQKDDAIDHERHAGQSVTHARLEGPHGNQVLDVRSIDVRETAVAGLTIVQAIHQPATGVLIGSEQTIGRHVDVRHWLVGCGLDRLVGETPQERHQRPAPGGIYPLGEPGHGGSRYSVTDGGFELLVGSLLLPAGIGEIGGGPSRGERTMANEAVPVIEFLRLFRRLRPQDASQADTCHDGE